MCVFCLHVPHLCQVPQEEKNESDPLELELQMSTVWVWEDDPGPPEKQHVLLIAESSLQPQRDILSNCQVMCPFKGISSENGSVSLHRTQLSATVLNYHSIKRSGQVSGNLGHTEVLSFGI